MALDAKTRHRRLETRRARRRARKLPRLVVRGDPRAPRTVLPPRWTAEETEAYRTRVRERGSLAQLTFWKAIGDYARRRAEQVWRERQERRVDRFPWPRQPLTARHLVLHPVLNPHTGEYVNRWRPAPEDAPSLVEKARRGVRRRKRKESV